MFKWGSRSLGYLDDSRMHPLVRSFMNEVLKESTVDITVIDGVRTQVEQEKLFSDNKSEMDGFRKMSDHQIEKYHDHLGRAIDCIPASGGIDLWNMSNDKTIRVWAELHRALLRVDRLWKQRGVDVGLELGWTYDIGASGRDYPHVSFKKL